MQAVNQLQFSHFHRFFLAGACNNGAVCTWDSVTQTELCRFDVGAGGHQGRCTGLVFSPCNPMLMYSVGDWDIICYDIVSNKVIDKWFVDYGRTLNLSSVDLLGDGSTLVVGTSIGDLLVFDLRKASNHRIKPVSTVDAHRHGSRFEISRVCFSLNFPVSSKVFPNIVCSQFGKKCFIVITCYWMLQTRRKFQHLICCSRTAPVLRMFSGTTLCLRKNAQTLKRYTWKLQRSILTTFGRNIQKTLE